MTDVQGLDEAYHTPNGLFVHGNTLYIAGTKTAQDVYDDFKLPFHMVERTKRYRDALHLINTREDTTRPIHAVVGHSLGAAVAQSLASPTKKARIYANPGFNPGTPPKTYVKNKRQRLDPISALDLAATTTSWRTWNPHNY